MERAVAGKSLTCNALFASEGITGQTMSRPQYVSHCALTAGGDCYMTLMDLPGVGESGTRDTEYAALYRSSFLPRLKYCG